MREPAQFRRIGRHGVGTPQPLQLQPVLDGTQEPVRLGQRRAVDLPDVAAFGQRVQSVQCGR
jgi:hypothetical protein